MTSLSWDDNGEIRTVIFDAATRVSPEHPATPTEHPIEEGANTSDHVRAELDSLTVEFVVSNTPINDLALTQADGARATLVTVDIPTPIDLPGPPLIPSIPVTSGVSVFGFDREFDRVRTVYELLIELRDSGQRIDVITSRREYEGMVITGLSPTFDAQNGEALIGVLSFRQIRVVSSEIVSVPDPEESRSETARNRGNRNGTTDESGRSGSILARIFL